jgi:flagellar export protein FliJ
VKKFVFALDWLLRLKRQRERLAELLLARARAESDLARARVAGLRGDLDRVARDLDAATAPGRWAAAAETATRLYTEIDAAERAAQLAADRLADAVRRRVRLTQEVEALRALRVQQWDDYRRDALRADQRRLDELSLRRWRPATAPPASERRP